MDSAAAVEAGRSSRCLECIAVGRAWSPLNAAVSHGHVECVWALLEQGANVNLPDKNGRTPLLIAATAVDATCANALLAAGADPDLAYLGPKSALRFTPLHVAVTCHNVACVGSLLSAGADPNSTDRNGCTPLHVVAHDPFYINANGVETLLLGAGADPDLTNQDGATPLLAAVLHDNEPCVTALLAAGADVDIADVSGRTAMFAAADSGFAACVRALHAAGA